MTTAAFPAQKPVYLADGTLWALPAPLTLKPPHLRLSIEEINSMELPPERKIIIPDCNPELRAAAFALLSNEPTREEAKLLLDKKHYGILREIFILYSDSTVDIKIRLSAAKWLGQRLSPFRKNATLQNTAIEENKELGKITRDAWWLVNGSTGIYAPNDLALQL